MKRLIGLLFILSCTLYSYAAKVDTISVMSKSMHKSILNIVIRPEHYSKNGKKLPVLYLLHGAGGNQKDWIKNVPNIKELVDLYNFIIVCPDGKVTSWYFDSPIDTAYRYETYIATEVVKFIDKNYRTIADKNHRAITGLSMGGHGALFLALRHAAVFGAAGSMSGGVDLSESRSRFDIIKRIGDTILQAKNWHDLSVINVIENYTTTALKIIFDCGDRDIFIEGNRRLHQKMQQLKIKHEYIERPGEHNWQYWSNAIPFQLLFFQRFFLTGR